MTAHARATPVAASARRYLRNGLPAAYHEDVDGRPPPVLDFLAGLELVLDPIVVLLDNLAAHLDPAIAPAELVDFLAELIGAPVDDTLDVDTRRRLLEKAPAISRRRGTRAGLEQALRLTVHDLEPTVHASGGVTTGRDPAAVPAAPPATVEVHLARRPTPGQRAQIDRCLADHRPVGVASTVVAGRRRTPAP